MWCELSFGIVTGLTLRTATDTVAAYVNRQQRPKVGGDATDPTVGALPPSRKTSSTHHASGTWFAHCLSGGPSAIVDSSTCRRPRYLWIARLRHDGPHR